MLLLAFALTASPLIFGHRLVLACLCCARTVIHVLFALLVTVSGYGLALLTLVSSYSSVQPLADALYVFGFALATLLAVGGGTLLAPRRLARRFVPAAGACAALFPFGLYLHNGSAGDWRTAFLWYGAGSLVGSIIAGRLTSRPAGFAQADRWSFAGR